MIRTPLRMTACTRHQPPPNRAGRRRRRRPTPRSRRGGGGTRVTTSPRRRRTGPADASAPSPSRLDPEVPNSAAPPQRRRAWASRGKPEAHEPISLGDDRRERLEVERTVWCGSSRGGSGGGTPRASGCSCPSPEFAAAASASRVASASAWK
ncbi:hypothetical protein DAI22_08g204700 [Oryza sativa Japonica Group]|nr:hypothetical protein DAI22_08g204700 [Oryza sativa Japonica Group]